MPAEELSPSTSASMLVRDSSCLTTRSSRHFRIHTTAVRTTGWFRVHTSSRDTTKDSKHARVHSLVDNRNTDPSLESCLATLAMSQSLSYALDITPPCEPRLRPLEWLDLSIPQPEHLVGPLPAGTFATRHPSQPYRDVHVESGKGEIRLVCLEKGARTDPIRCKLVKASLEDERMCYDALSYVWGPSAREEWTESQFWEDDVWRTEWFGRADDEKELPMLDEHHRLMIARHENASKDGVMTPEVRPDIRCRGWWWNWALRDGISRSELRRSYQHRMRAYYCEKQCLVILNGQSFVVRRNLYDALCSFRRTDRSMTLWVDALCSNQTSKVEQSQQVRLMSRIFSKARNVFLWLSNCRLYAEDMRSFANWDT